MNNTQVVAAVQKNVSILKESGWWEIASVDPFWAKTHEFIVVALTNPTPDITQEMNARYMAYKYFNIADAWPMKDIEGEANEP